MSEIKLEKIRCNLCGGSDTKLVYSKPDLNPVVRNKPMPDYEFKVVKCQQCGLAYVNPRPPVESMNKFYPERYYQDHTPKLFAERYSHYYSFINDLDKGKLLDIGCSRGGFVKYCQSQGWQAEGVDLFAPEENQQNIRRGYFPEMDYEERAYDVITSWAVFEHLHDPSAFFEKTFKILKPGGRFIILTTNFDSLGSRYSWEEDVPRHLYFFTPKTISSYLDKSGYKKTPRFIYDDRVFRLDGSSFFTKKLLTSFGYSLKDIDRKNYPKSIELLTKFTNLAGSVLFSKGRILQKIFKKYGIVVTQIEK